MLTDFEEILSAALSLSPGERAMLADHLLASLDGPDQKRIDALWADEAERRLREIDEGRVKTIDGEQVMRELRAPAKRMTYGYDADARKEFNDATDLGSRLRIQDG